MTKVVKQRDYGRIVIGCLAVIAFGMFMGWYSKTSQPNTTLETTKSIPKPQSTVMEGLTEQTELLKAKRDAMALPVAEPPPKRRNGLDEGLCLRPRQCGAMLQSPRRY